jgi:hypothetical protein
MVLEKKHVREVKIVYYIIQPDFAVSMFAKKNPSESKFA